MFSQTLASVASWGVGSVAASQRKSAVLPPARPLIQTPASMVVALEWSLGQSQGAACELKPSELVHGHPV